MPRTKRAKPIYERGGFALCKRPDRSNLEIVWYDHELRRERSASARTSDYEEGKLALDRRYLQSEGQRLCPTCGQQFAGEVAPLLARVIADYLVQSEGKAGYKSACERLGHVVDYLSHVGAEVTLPMVNERWVNGFRQWLLGKPVYSGKGRYLRERAVGSVEPCVMQLAAAINATPGHTAQFKPQQLKDVSASPTYRADIAGMAAMFNYCLRPKAADGGVLSRKERSQARLYRQNLLKYLRIAVATWSRPDAIYELTAAQWHREAGVVALNPARRRQTRKYRPTLPLARQLHAWFDTVEGRFVPVSTVRGAWDNMRKELGLPGGGEAGPKLIRRSMATVARRRLGEAQWVQGEMMLGHKKASTSDIYALPEPSHLGGALAVTEDIIDEIEELAPGAFTAVLPQSDSR
ncbi:MAG: hypothetical protein VYD90_01750 [Pseudomonadota bacterium]|nr:hypothetical protein [Pseudomonadota bacterium]